VLVFAGTTAVHGAELWRYGPQVVSGAYAVFVDSGQIITSKDFGNFRVVTAGANQTVSEGTAVNFTSTVNDPNPVNGSNFTYLWQVVANNGQTVPNGTTPTFTFTPRDNGVYTVTLRITDNDDGARPYSDTLIVTANNLAPLVSIGGDVTIPTGNNFARSGSFADPG